jgi:hypothetical protein
MRTGIFRPATLAVGLVALAGIGACLPVFRDRRPETYTTIASEEIYHTPSATAAETAHQASRRRPPQRRRRGGR